MQLNNEEYNSTGSDNNFSKYQSKYNSWSG